MAVSLSHKFEKRDLLAEPYARKKRGTTAGDLKHLRRKDED